MSARFYDIALRWGAREESTHSCAVRLARMLDSLAAIHPAFRKWNRQGYNEEQWNKPFCVMPPDVDELTDIFERSRQYTDTSRELMPDLGFSASAWNGSEGPLGVNASWRAGAYGDFPDFPNAVEMNVDGPTVDNADLINPDTLKSLFLAMIEAWEPSWASIVDGDYWKPFYEKKPFPPFRSGWMTYFSAPYAKKITAPLSAIVESTKGGGILILATNEPFTTSDPKHVAVADAIQACLEPFQSDPRLLREK